MAQARASSARQQGQASKKRITPFWQRFPAFFRYPFHPRVLLVFLGLAIATMATSGLPWILALVPSIALFVFLIKYALDILARTAEGKLDPPPLDSEILLQGYGMPFKLAGIFIVIGLMPFVIFPIASLLPDALAPLFLLLGIAVFLLALTLIPASIMTLAFRQSLREALDPAELWHTVRATGWGYVALLGCLLLLNGGSTTALGWLASGLGLPPLQLMVLGSVLNYYFLFVMFHLMGYLLYQYHDRLGYEPDAQAELDGEVDGERHYIKECIDDENYKRAITELQRKLQAEPHDLELGLWLHRVALMAGDDDTLLDYAGGLIEDLIDAGRIRDATEVYRACQDIEPEARPARPTDYYPLAKMMLEAKEPGRTLKLASGFHKSFPDSEEIPRLYLLVAEIMAEHKQQPEKACAVLAFIQRKFPDATEIRRAQALRTALTT